MDMKVLEHVYEQKEIKNKKIITKEMWQ